MLFLGQKIDILTKTALLLSIIKWRKITLNFRVDSFAADTLSHHSTPLEFFYCFGLNNNNNNNDDDVDDL